MKRNLNASDAGQRAFLAKVLVMVANRGLSSVGAPVGRNLGRG